MLTYREITEILKMVDASECEEFVLELEGMKLVVKRGGSGAASSSTTVPNISSSQTSSSETQNQPVSASANASEGEPLSVSSTGVEMRSPMVGTFYRRPSPDSSAFVEMGDRVEPGTRLCIIEVMKLFTTIESTVSGTVANILADDGDMVEYDQLLFVFDPVPS